MPEKPVILIEITRDSRLRLTMQDAGAVVAYVDRRVDPILVILPDRPEPIEFQQRVAGIPVYSQESDDEARSAEATIRRLQSGLVVVSGKE